MVDDLAFKTNSPRLLGYLKNHLAANFDVKLFGTLKFFVGWNILRGADGITINQSGYAESILEEYGMERG